MTTRFSKEIADLLHGPPPNGTPFGDVFPFRPPPRPPLVDGRTTALRILKKYLSELVFWRSGGKDPASGAELDPISFKVPERDIHVEWPDSVEDVHLPAIAFLSEAPADYEAIGMTSYVEENTTDVYEPGTVLVWLNEYVETFVIELWAETKAQRRSMLLGLEQALSPLEYMAGIRFKMPDYYGQLVCFALMTRELVDDELAVRLRRRARLRVEMRYNVVALYPVQPMVPEVELDVDPSPEDAEEVEAEPDEG